MVPEFKPAILNYFAWEHLPPHLAEVSRPFAEHAQRIASIGSLPGADRAEATVALRKLLESKDAAVRAAVSAAAASR
ncbi:MAG: hypothetical protein KC613_25955 [Myxococcales bacterium]|nr:hypothetical protein [Myxococcales bacterium]